MDTQVCVTKWPFIVTGLKDTKVAVFLFYRLDGRTNVGDKVACFSHIGSMDARMSVTKWRVVSTQAQRRQKCL